jgi:L-rhamnose mutarotase
MQRAGFLLKVREDKMDEYKKRHENVWPGMLEALSRQGWRNFSLFMREDGLLFGYVEAEESFEKCLEAMATEPANLEWQEHMAHLFEGLEGSPDQSMVKLEHVFHLD